MRNEDKSINRQFDFSKFTKINELMLSRKVQKLPIEIIKELACNIGTI